MKKQRYFLGWSSPALLSAADFLLEKYSKNGECDLSSMFVALPTSRAARRFLELLAWRAGEGEAGKLPVLLAPPQIVTLKQLPLRLLKEETLKKIAPEAATALAWVRALQGMERRELQQVYAKPPKEEQILSWWTLAQELSLLDDELARSGISYRSIEEYCTAQGLRSAVRWRILGEIAAAMRRQLQSSELVCEADALRLAAENKGLRKLRGSSQIILLAITGLDFLTRRLLEQGEFETVSLIHAPSELAAGFGHYGELVPEFWAERPIDLQEDKVRIANRAVEQVGFVTDFLEELPPEMPDDAFTVGLGDENLAPVLVRALNFSGKRVHHIGANYLAESSPLRLLARLAEFVAEQRPENFRALLRHPSFEKWLERRGKYSVSERCLLSLCNQYFSESIPVKVTLYSSPLPLPLKQVLEAIESLLPEGYASQKRSMKEWAEPISDMLKEVYSEEVYSLDNPERMEEYAVFAELGKLFKELSPFGAESELSPPLNFVQAIRFLLHFAARVPLSEQSAGATVELVRWSEVHLDDAPFLALVGLNEGYIPDNVISSPFLTDSLREEFGVWDNRFRYARDAYFLAAICASRKKILLACSRQSLQGDPIQPSRLLFAGGVETTLQRARKFYQEPETEEKEEQVFSFTYGKTDRLATIPRPVPLPVPLSGLGVTQFRDYLACPYRFYLMHICELRPQIPLPVEMQAYDFGNLCHEVLREYGKEVINRSGGSSTACAGQISELLNELLERAVRRKFGVRRPAAVEIQAHQLGRRLQMFACKQEKEFAKGWQIWRVEQQLEKSIEVDGEPFQVFGTADRIDFHPETGKYRIIDYKTSSSKQCPEKSHYNNGRWHNLQLPLYRRISRSVELEPSQVEVGFFSLPASLGETTLEMARWDKAALQKADEVTEDVVRDLRAQKYWPPSGDAENSWDGLSEICLDGHAEKERIIMMKEAPLIDWPQLGTGKS